MADAPTWAEIERVMLSMDTAESALPRHLFLRQVPRRSPPENLVSQYSIERLCYVVVVREDCRG